ncbi:hypothetical protein [Fervidibacillus albus]|uniref:Uncharacterized protein n=1 Tax=Fervidibacillus albus TaxID=2980026 RepID=A0A9E8LWZ7_9BACI|nr:hypothetical protein [Fervidibacillus albus]WAA10631.1 hypothetical protein OE104_04745 [Fervidibacillus albus]
MYITYENIARLFPQSKGMKNDKIRFETISFCTNKEQPNGLFIPLFENDLEEAEKNGAIAALWSRNEPLPLSIGMDFPILYVNHLQEAAIQIVEHFGVNHINHDTKMIIGNRSIDEQFTMAPSAANQKHFLLLLDEWKGRV